MRVMSTTNRDSRTPVISHCTVTFMMIKSVSIDMYMQMVKPMTEVLCHEHLLAHTEIQIHIIPLRNVQSKHKICSLEI